MFITQQTDDECCGAGLAFDKDLTTVAASIAGPETADIWIKIKLRKSSYIQKVIIHLGFYKNWYDPTESCVQDVGKYEKCKDEQNNVNVEVFQGDTLEKSCGTLRVSYGQNQGNQIYSFFCNADGDTVLLSKSLGQIAASEIVVIGDGK